MQFQNAYLHSDGLPCYRFVTVKDYVYHRWEYFLGAWTACVTVLIMLFYFSYAASHLPAAAMQFAMILYGASLLMTWFFILPRSKIKWGWIGSLVIATICSMISAGSDTAVLSLFFYGLAALFASLGIALAVALHDYWKSDSVVAGMVGGFLTTLPIFAYWWVTVTA